MKRTLLAAVLAVLGLGLGGCVAVPVYDGGPGYGYDSYYYAPYYAAPAATFSFGYVYRDGGHWHGRRGGRWH